VARSSDTWFTGFSHLVDGQVTPRTTPGATLTGMEAALSEVLEHGPLEIRPSRHVAVLDGTTLRLTRHELGLLIALATHSGGVVSREDLAEIAWGRPLGSGDRSVDVYVRRLRGKLAEAAPDWEFIHTHFAFGYRFSAERSQSFHIQATSA
jgi:DNA-binding response OmpR family regulator